jgi:isopropylmalate/homocitrate/citramalate synthase
MASSKKKTTTRNEQPKETDAGLTPQVDLVDQALETEMGGVEIYTTALQCVQDDDLREEWEEYLEQTKDHVEVMRDLCEKLGLDPDRDTPGRQVVRHIGKSLVKAMQMALGAGEPEAAEIVAAECVLLAETKDHANWSLIGKLAEHGRDVDKAALQEAYDEVEEEEDEHLYHTRGWARELWLDALELPAQLPPPEEEEDVKSEEEAVQVKQKSMTERG